MAEGYFGQQAFSQQASGRQAFGRQAFGRQAFGQQRHLADRHLANRHLADRHLTNKHLKTLCSINTGMALQLQIFFYCVDQNVCRQNDFRLNDVAPSQLINTIESV